MKIGIYDLEGNHVVYEGGNTAYDEDSASEIDLDYLAIMGEYVCSLEEFEEGDF